MVRAKLAATSATMNSIGAAGARDTEAVCSEACGSDVVIDAGRVVTRLVKAGHPVNLARRVSTMSLETGRDQQSSEYDRDLGLSAPAQDFQRDLAAMAAEIDVDARLIELQVAQHDLVQERRQARIDEADFARGRVEFESERRFEQRERRGAR